MSAEIDEFEDDEEEPEAAPPKARSKREIADERESAHLIEFRQRERWGDGGAMDTLHPSPLLTRYRRPYRGFAKPAKPVTFVSFDEWPKIVGKVPHLPSERIAEWIAGRFSGGKRQALIDFPTHLEAVDWARRRVSVDGIGGGCRGGYEHYLTPKKGGYYVGLFLIPEDATPSANRYGEATYEGNLAYAGLVTFEMIATHSRLVAHPHESILNYRRYEEHPPTDCPGVLYWLDWARHNAHIPSRHALVWQAVNRAMYWSKLGGDDTHRFEALAVCLTRGSRGPIGWGARVGYKLDSYAHKLFLDIAARCKLTAPDWMVQEWAPNPGNALGDPWHDPEEIHAVPHYGEHQRRVNLYQYTLQEEWYVSGTHRSRMWGEDPSVVSQPSEDDVRAIIAEAFASEPGPSNELEPWRSWRQAWLRKRDEDAERDRVLATLPPPSDHSERGPIAVGDIVKPTTYASGPYLVTRIHGPFYEHGPLNGRSRSDFTLDEARAFVANPGTPTYSLTMQRIGEHRADSYINGLSLDDADDPLHYYSNDRLEVIKMLSGPYNTLYAEHRRLLAISPASPDRDDDGSDEEAKRPIVRDRATQVRTDGSKRPARKAREGQLSLFGDEGAP